jgi:hypothetical protein
VCRPQHWTLDPEHPHTFCCHSRARITYSSFAYLRISYPQGGEAEEGEDAVNVDSEGEMEDDGNAAYSTELVDDSDEEPEMAPPPKKKSKKGSQWESL